MKLSDEIRAQNLPLGTTPEGQAFCLKALHPADPISQVLGIPTGESQPTVMQRYQMTASINPPGTDSTKTGWECHFVFFPHPVIYGYCVKSYADGTSPTTTFFVNAQVLGTDTTINYGTLTRRLLSWCDAYRCAYWGVTGNFDAPALSNQGSLVAAQYPYKPRVVSLCGMPGAGACQTAGTSTSFADPADEGFHWEPDLPFDPSIPDQPQRPEKAPEPRDKKLASIPAQPPYAVSNLVDAYIEAYRSFDQLVVMPNAYIGLTKDGFYCPGQMPQGFDEWTDMMDRRSVLNYTDAGVALGDRTDDTAAGVLSTVAHVGLPFGTSSPFTSASTHSTQWGVMFPRRCHDNVIQVTARNMSLTSSWTLMMRYGFELKVGPTSPLSAQMALGPADDPVARAAIYQIFRRLKHGYPADYNDLSKILKVIGGLASTILPMLPWPIAKVIGGAGGAALTAAGGALERRYAAGKPTGPRDQPAAAAVDDVRKALQLRQLKAVQRSVGARTTVRPKAPKPKKPTKTKRRAASSAGTVWGEVPPREFQ